MAAGAARDDKDARKANKRGAARLAAVQALYQMDLAGTGLNEILAEFESHWIGREVEGAQYLPAEAAFFRDIVSGVVREQREIDPLIDDALSKSWPLKRIEAVLRAALRAGAYELIHRVDVPARVGDHFLLMSDGFYRLVDTYRRYTYATLIEEAQRGLPQLLRDLREIEDADPECRKYPRLKPRDDATAVLVRVEC